MSAHARDNDAPTQANNHPWRRVSRREHCPICDDHDSTCLIFDNGDVLCAHVTSDELEDRFLGQSWWHRFEQSATRPQSWSPRTPTPSTPHRPRADATNLDAVYRVVRSHSVLSDEHHALLTGPLHGLSDAQAQRYGTPPTDQATMLADLLTRFSRDTLLTVPGFREKDGQLYFHDYTSPERRRARIALFVHDLQGRIVAIHLRDTARVAGGSKYLPATSVDATHPDAPSPGTPAHIALPAGGVRHAYIIGITEGVKKADVAADALGYPVIGLAGTGCTSDGIAVLTQIADERPEVTAVDIMLDRDDPTAKEGRTAAAVNAARLRLATAAVRRGFAVRNTQWNPADAKGIDELLIAGHAFTVERFRPVVVEETMGADTADTTTDRDPDTGKETPEEPPRYGVPTFKEALALPHPTLARRHVEVAQQLNAANTYLDHIKRISKHQAVITPEDDPTAKRRRPVLTPTDRMCGVNALLDIRAASHGALSTKPVPLYRAAIAANGTSDSTVSSCMTQLARVGMFEQLPPEKDDDTGRRLYALPAIMPHDIPRDKILTFDSPRRHTERHRPCGSCGGTEFERTTRTRVVCKGCGDIATDKTHTLTLCDHDDDAAADTALSSMDTPPVANCDTEMTATAEKSEGTGSSTVTNLSVAICNGGVDAPAPSASGSGSTRPFSSRRQNRIGDRAAARGHRMSSDHLPRVDSDTEDVRPAPVDETDRSGVAAPTWMGESLRPSSPPSLPSSPPAPPCRYEAHRGHEWARPDGRGLVCGVCHPQPPPRTLHIPGSAAPGQGQGQGVRS
jgi:hypothetical protein